MKLEKFKDTSGNVRYKLNDKRISARDAQLFIGLEEVPFVDNTQPAAQKKSPLTRSNGTNHINCADRLTAINLIEAEINYPFIIDGKYKGCECVFAKNAVGDELEMHDNFIKVIKFPSKTVTYYWLDIPESAFIAGLNLLTAKAINDGVMPDTFTVTGTSGTVYTYRESSLELIDATAPSAETEISTQVAQFKMLLEKQKMLINLNGDDVKSYTVTERLRREIASLALAIQTPSKTELTHTALVA